MTKQEIIESLKGGLIVSCQTEPKDCIHEDGRTVVTMAKAAKWGGAVGIRSNSPEQVKAIHEAVDLPIIGLDKIYYDTMDRLIMTPTIEHAKALWEAGARIIALEATNRPNHLGVPTRNLITEIKKELPEAIILADVDNVDNAIEAAKLGADLVAPTLAGNTEATAYITEPPAYREVAEMCRAVDIPVIMEGHVYDPESAMKCLYLGCYAVVVGSAITRPHFIVKRFTDLLNKFPKDSNWRDDERTWQGPITKLEK